MRISRLIVGVTVLLLSTAAAAQEGSGEGPVEVPDETTDGQGSALNPGHSADSDSDEDADGVDDEATEQLETAIADDPTTQSEPSTVVVFEETARERFEWFGERNLFGIRILGAQVIEAEFVVSEPTYAEGFGDIVSISVHGQTSGFFDAIYPVENSAVTYIDLDTGLPLYTNYDYNERDYVSNNTVEWLHDDYRARVHRVDPEEDIWETANIPAMAYDEAAMFMELRSRDIEIGDQMVLYQYDGLSLWRMVGTVIAHEPVWVDAENAEVLVAHIEFAAQEMQSESATPWGTDLPGLPPVMRPIDDPEVLATGLIGVGDSRMFVGADIDTPIGNLIIRLNEHRSGHGE